MSDNAQTLIRRCNTAWQDQDWETLEGCYHPDAILLPPDAGEPITGRSEIIATYQEFMAVATINEFVITELSSFEIAGTNLVHMRFELEYQLNGQTLKDIGLEVYVLAADGSGQIVWRNQAITDQLMLAE